MNKKVVTKVLVLLALSFVFFSCQQNSDDNNNGSYAIESGIVSNSVAEEARYRAGSYGGNLTFSNVKAVRDYLYENTPAAQYNGVQRGVKRNEVHSFLTSHGSSKSNADAQLAFLDSNGNNIAFFYVTNESNKKAWVYAVKE